MIRDFIGLRVRQRKFISKIDSLKRVDSRKNAFLLVRISLYHRFTFLAPPICQIFEYSRLNHGFDSTNLWRCTVRQIPDSTSNIRIFGFDRVKIPFTGMGMGGTFYIADFVKAPTMRRKIWGLTRYSYAYYNQSHPADCKRRL